MKNALQTRPLRAEQKRDLIPATAAQIVRQAVLILVVIALWAGLLIVFLNLTGGEEVPVAEVPQPTEVVAAPEPTQVATSTEPPLATATATHTVPAATETSEATSGPTELPTEPSEATASPTEVPTETEVPPSPTELPTETETPSSPTDTPTPPVAASASFSGDVQPILTSRCQRCHGGERIEAGLDLLSYPGVIAGSENGPVVILGDSAASILVQQIVSGEMPRRAPRLPPSEIETIATWVDEGALDN